MHSNPQDRNETCRPELRPFDARVAAAVLYKLADLADRARVRVVDSTHPAFSTAAGVLGDTKAWLRQYRMPFPDFAGNLLLRTLESKAAVATDTFTSALIRASIELESVARLVELRDVRVHADS